MADLREQIDMTDPIARCLGIEEGAPCTDLATITLPVPLCTHHQMQVAVAIVPEMLASAASLARRTPLPAEHDAEAHRTAAKARMAGLDLTGVHGARVYFVRNGDRVKIGYSTNLRSRLDALCLRPDSALLLLEGGKDLESALHRHFAAHRVPNTEWFRYADEIKTYISAKLDGHTIPASRSVYIDEAEATKNVAAADFRTGPVGEVVVSRDALLQVIEAHMGHGRSVHLVDVLTSLQQSGAPGHWTVTALRDACTRNGIVVRRTVRIGSRVTVGVHRDDLAVIPSPSTQS